MKIAVFLHGTVIVHKNAYGKSPKEIVQQVIEQEDSVRDFSSYIPIGNSSQKLQTWANQGAEICYLSALTTSKKGRGDEVVGVEGLRVDLEILRKYSFPEGIVLHRVPNETYKQVIERISPLPDVIIEDDCQSIGSDGMVFPSLDSEVRQNIKSIPVPEFGGIDHLPDDVHLLVS